MEEVKARRLAPIKIADTYIAKKYTTPQWLTTPRVDACLTLY